jgi:hypothetical protein
MDEANAIKTIIYERNMKQKDLATLIGRCQGYISNRLALLCLSGPAQELLSEYEFPLETGIHRDLQSSILIKYKEMLERKRPKGDVANRDLFNAAVEICKSESRKLAPKNASENIRVAPKIADVTPVKLVTSVNAAPEIVVTKPVTKKCSFCMSTMEFDSCPVCDAVLSAVGLHDDIVISDDVVLSTANKCIELMQDTVNRYNTDKASRENMRGRYIKSFDRIGDVVQNGRVADLALMLAADADRLRIIMLNVLEKLNKETNVEMRPVSATLEHVK